jgi:hypothetical protein
MGLLDDAIREHLELKRRRGADPDEVARQEDEALGDPRNVAPASAAAEPDTETDLRPADPGEPALEEEDEGDESEPPSAAADAPAAYVAPEPEPDPEPDEPWLEDDVEPPGEHPTPEFAPRTADAEPETDVVQPDDEPAADEDVLEETPEFLQETPEHDRLWFEQKPPRDFDF